MNLSATYRPLKRGAKIGYYAAGFPVGAEKHSICMLMARKYRAEGNPPRRRQIHRKHVDIYGSLQTWASPNFMVQ